jgi:dissimilatory sulfite reductase related protein
MKASDLGVGFATNADGYLSIMSSWDHGIAEALARRNEIWPLTEDHWKVIDYLRDYYLTYNQGPVILKISRATGLSAQRICELFPCGMIRGAYRIAGLPRPPGCA